MDSSPVTAAPEPALGALHRLHYGGPPRFRRIWLKLALLAVLALVVSFIARPTWRRIQLLAAERECIRVKAPPTQVVSWFLGRQQDQLAVVSDRGFDIPTGEGFASPRYGYRRSSRWQRLDNLLRQNIPNPPQHHWRTDDLSIVFEGQLKSPAGVRRLVVVELDYQVIASVPHPGFVITTVHPIPVFGTPKMEITFFDRWKSRDVERFFDFRNYGGIDMRLFAGQVDPKDPSHFTVQVHMDEKREMIEGWLLDDGTVSLAFRGIPASITDWRDSSP